MYEYDYAQAGLSQPVSVDEGMDSCRSMLEATLLLPRLLSAKQQRPHGLLSLYGSTHTDVLHGHDYLTAHLFRFGYIYLLA